MPLNCYCCGKFVSLRKGTSLHVIPKDPDKSEEYICPKCIKEGTQFHGKPFKEVILEKWLWVKEVKEI